MLSGAEVMVHVQYLARFSPYVLFVVSLIYVISKTNIDRNDIISAFVGLHLVQAL